jgi:molybdate transport system substrate-binding protein
MKIKGDVARSVTLIVASLLVFAGLANAADVNVMSSAGFSAAYKELLPEFERATGNKVVSAWGPSMGSTPQAVPNRIARGEPVDVVIVVGEALDDLIRSGKVLAASRVDFARGKIGMVVRAGARKPDIATVEALKRTLIEAKSIAYSDSASGVYLSTVLFPKLGVAEQIRDRARMIPAEPVAQVVARGEAEIGFQQLSELIPVKGVDLVGLIPEEVQKVTLFSGAIAVNAKQPDAGRALLEHLSSPAAAPAIIRSGMEPVTH